MNATLLLRPRLNRLFRQMDSFAKGSGYNISDLDKIRESSELCDNKETAYYLASLYLSIEEYSIANDLLSAFDCASGVMKKYFHVLSYSTIKNLPTPKLTKDESSCLEFLQTAVNPVNNTFESAVLGRGKFSLVGNAPGPVFQQSHEGVHIYFNNYISNNRITEKAELHVVTPSWDIDLTNTADVICITGSNIFYRRSRVWQKFINNRNQTTIYTVPTHIWSSLYKELAASPSAGLLVLSWIENISSRNPQVLTGHVAGFSYTNSSINHGYDAEPASSRHNWQMERVIRERIVESLSHSCRRLTVEI